MGVGSSRYVHHVSEALRRAFADRARWLGDPEQVPDMPVERLVSKEYAAELRRTIRDDAASGLVARPLRVAGGEHETTHLSVVDADRNAVSLTYTLEDSYGSKIVVPGAGFLLNNEMGDFNAGPRPHGRDGPDRHGPEPRGPRASGMLSSMTPTIVVQGRASRARRRQPGRPHDPEHGARCTHPNVIDFGMNAQEAVDQPRFFHQWLPDRIHVERHGFSADTVQALARRGHTVVEIEKQGVAEAIVVNRRERLLEGGCDRRAPDGAAIGR